MKALILAAGYATRLYPLTKEYPKPLLLIKKRPIIDYIIDKLEKCDAIDEIIVVTNSKFISKFKKWKKKIHAAKRITLIDDLTKDNASRRGAIGDIEFAIDKKDIKDDLLVVGGDNLFDEDLSGFLSSAGGHKASLLVGAYNIGNRRNARKYGVIKLGAGNKVIEFQEKPKNPRSTLIAMCLYYFPRKHLRLIKEYIKKRKNKSDATGSYVDWLIKKISVYGFIFGGSWYDIGDRYFYRHAEEEFIK